jgi:hypothetical protein
MTQRNDTTSFSGDDTVISPFAEFCVPFARADGRVA